MKDVTKYTLLFDCYKSLLTKKEQLAFSDYYEADLSIGEIAENNHVSRSAVFKIIKTVEEKLNNYETNLELVKKNQQLNALLEETNIIVIKEKIQKIITM